MFSKYLFIFLSALALYAAMMVLISKKPIHSVLYLILCFFAIAGHYILLNAQTLAVVHVIVYAGAVMVLFIYTVMLLNLNIQNEFQKPRLIKVAAIVSGGLLFLTLIGILRTYDLAVTHDPSLTQIGLIKNIGKVRFEDFLLPFEISSV